MDKTLCFIGAGSMTEAILSGMIKQRTIQPGQISAVNRGDQSRLKQLEAQFGIKVDPERKEELIQEADILLLAMKPNDLTRAIGEIRSYTHTEQLILSVVAGMSTEVISHLLGHAAPVIRTMPNTSAVIGMSATALSPGKQVHEEDIKIAEAIFKSIGQVYILEEEQLDAVTGLAGSGPAYIYYLVEAMIKGGVDVGLSADHARQLTIQTLLGAATMLKETGEEPAMLRKKVTSPNGTTEKGIETLQAYRFEEAIRHCIKQATQRSIELGAQSPTQFADK